MGSRRRAQSPSSVNKTSQWQLACVFRHAHSAPRCGYKRRARANAHQLFASEPSHSASEPSKSPECSQDKSHRRALVLRHISGGRCPVLLFLCGHAATSPRRFSAPKRENSQKSNLKSSTSDGRLFKDGFPLVRFWMWSFPYFIWWSRSLPLVLGL